MQPRVAECGAQVAATKSVGTQHGCFLELLYQIFLLDIKDCLLHNCKIQISQLF
jgi:hypothetical protein